MGEGSITPELDIMGRIKTGLSMYLCKFVYRSVVTHNIIPFMVVLVNADMLLFTKPPFLALLI